MDAEQIYEFLGIYIVAWWLIAAGPFQPFAFAGVCFLVTHIAVTQGYLVSSGHKSKKPSQTLKTAHYLTLCLVYFCAIGQFVMGAF